MSEAKMTIVRVPGVGPLMERHNAIRDEAILAKMEFCDAMVKRLQAALVHMESGKTADCHKELYEGNIEALRTQRRLEEMAAEMQKLDQDIQRMMQEAAAPVMAAMKASMQQEAEGNLEPPPAPEPEEPAVVPVAGPRTLQ